MNLKEWRKFWVQKMELWKIDLGWFFPWEIFVGISAEKELQQMCEYEVVKDWRIGLGFLFGEIFVGIFSRKRISADVWIWSCERLIDWVGFIWEDFCGNFQQKKAAQNNPAVVWIDHHHHHHHQQQLQVFYLLFADWRNWVRSFARPFSLWQQGLDALLWER